MKRFNKVYLEISNVCNLKCSFCPGTRRPRRFLSAEEFALFQEIYGEFLPCAEGFPLRFLFSGAEELCKKGAKIILSMSSYPETVTSRDNKNTFYKCLSAKQICGVVCAECDETESTAKAVYSANHMIYECGARLFVAGSSVFRAEDPAKAIDELIRCGTSS